MNVSVASRLMAEIPAPSTLRGVVLAACQVTRQAIADIRSQLTSEDEKQITFIPGMFNDSLLAASSAVEKLERLIEVDAAAAEAAAKEGKEALSVPLLAMQEAISKAQEALKNIGLQLQIADEKYEVSKTVKTLISTAKERGEEELAKAQKKVEEARGNLQDFLQMYGLKIYSKSLEFAKDSFTKIDSQYGVMDKVKQSINVAGEVVEGLDAKYNVVENVKAQYSTLDKSYNISDHVSKHSANLISVVDGYTGGKATDAVAYAQEVTENTKSFYQRVRKESTENKAN